MRTENNVNDVNFTKLDDIVNYILEKSGTDPRCNRLSFVKRNDHILMEKIKEYSQDIKKTNGNLDEEVIESISASLFDVITQVNMDYFRCGIKMGAQLLTELIF